MKILFINGVFPVISQTFVLDHIKGFKESGNTVEVLARKKAGFRFDNGVHECHEGLLYIKPVNFRLILRCLKGFIKRPFSSLYLSYLRVCKKIHMQTLVSYLQLNQKPDVIITHFGNNYPISIQLKKYVLKNTKNVIIFHGHDVTSYIEKNGWNNYRKVENYVDYALTVNKHFAELIQKNTNIKNVECLYLGTNLPEVTRVLHNQKEVQLLFVGRFVEKKGLNYLLLACKQLKVQGVNFKLHIIGDGPLTKIIRQEIIVADLVENIVLYGAKQHSFIMRMMASCDIFVLPSVVAANKDSEGLPVVLMEAMNAGILVISSHHSGIPELIQHNKNGFLVKEGDFINLAYTLKYAIFLEEKKKLILLKNAKIAVRQQHDKICQVDKLVKLLS